MPILITGATGKVGSEITKALLLKNIAVAIAGRNNKRAVELFGDEIEFREFDAYKPETYRATLKGIQKMFLLGTEGKESVAKWKLIIDEAKQQQIEHIVFLSSLGAELIEDRPQRLIEMYLAQSGIAFTILRPNFFFQNFSTDEAFSIRNGKIFLPCGNGKTSFVDTRDIAAVAAEAFGSSSPNNGTIPITGNKALDYFEVAQIFTDVLGKKVEYLNPSNEEYSQALKEQNASDDAIKGILWLYDSVKKGEWEATSNEVHDILGRQPISFAEFVKEHKAVWK